MWRARWSRWDLISHSLIRTQKVSQETGSSPGVLRERSPDPGPSPRQGRSPGASPSLVQDSRPQGTEMSLPTGPLTRLKHLVIWNQNSIFPFHPYNVLLKQTFYFGKFETFTKVEKTVQ